MAIGCHSMVFGNLRYKVLHSKAHNIEIMYEIPKSNYLLCVFENEMIIDKIFADSKAELLQKYDEFSKDLTCVAISWLEVIEKGTRLLTIIKQNLKINNDELYELLIDLNQQVFDFNEDWMKENV